MQIKFFEKRIDSIAVVKLFIGSSFGFTLAVPRKFFDLWYILDEDAKYTQLFSVMRIDFKIMKGFQLFFLMLSFSFYWLKGK